MRETVTIQVIPLNLANFIKKC